MYGFGSRLHAAFERAKFTSFRWVYIGLFLVAEVTKIETVGEEYVLGISGSLRNSTSFWKGLNGCRKNTEPHRVFGALGYIYIYIDTYDMYWYTVTQVRCMYILEERVWISKRNRKY